MTRHLKFLNMISQHYAYLILQILLVNLSLGQNNTNTSIILTSTSLAGAQVTNTSSSTTTTTTTSTTTTPKQACTSNYCNSNGICLETNGNLVCNCNPGFTGSTCQQKVCTGQCLNGGACLINYKEDNVPHCYCNSNYEGALCEKPLCIGYCYNSGRCESERDNKTMKCNCVSNRFYGDRCEFDKCKDEERKSCSSSCYLSVSESTNTCKCNCNRECDELFCNSNGKCTSESGQLKCKCNTGYAGPQCTIDLCKGYCFNDGFCNRNMSNTIVCECSSEFTGKRCELLSKNANTSSKAASHSSAYRVFGYFFLIFALFGVFGAGIYYHRNGSLNGITKSITGIFTRFRSYERAPQSNGTSTNSSIPYLRTNNNNNTRSDEFTNDPFS